MEIVAIWKNLEKNATQIMIFLGHHMWAENTLHFQPSTLSALRRFCFVHVSEFIQSNGINQLRTYIKHYKNQKKNKICEDSEESS